MSALEYASGQTAEVVGKPEKSFFLSAVTEFCVKAEECVMIGDVSTVIIIKETMSNYEYRIIR